MFSSAYKIKFGQCDPGGIMYFANLFDLAHWIYEDLLQDTLPESNYFEHKSLAIPLVHAEADYLLPLKLHQKVELKLEVAELKTTSFTLITNFYDQSDTLAAKVRTVHVCVNREDFEKREIPDDLRKVLAKYSG
jgi:YbgC/YbaW family acyl-CoA thioester hydrolase